MHQCFHSCVQLGALVWTPHRCLVRIPKTETWSEFGSVSVRSRKKIRSQCRPPDSCGLYIGSPRPPAVPVRLLLTTWCREEFRCAAPTLGINAGKQPVEYSTSTRVNPYNGFDSSLFRSNGAAQNVSLLQSQSLPRLWHHEESPWKRGTVPHIGWKCKVNACLMDKPVRRFTFGQ